MQSVLNFRIKVPLYLNFFHLRYARTDTAAEVIPKAKIPESPRRVYKMQVSPLTITNLSMVSMKLFSGFYILEGVSYYYIVFNYFSNTFPSNSRSNCSQQSQIQAQRQQYFLQCLICANQYFFIMFSFAGNPIILEGSGRIKTDPINQQRIELVLSHFEEWAIKNGRLEKFKYAISRDESDKSLIAFPAAGFAFGAISSYAFVHPNSKYIGKFFTLFTTWLGYKLYQHYLQSYNISRRFGNFWNYPSQIQKMIDNNDARYAHRWLKNQYLEIENSE